MRTVYLAGPIAGCTQNEATGWRERVTKTLGDIGIHAISPLRCEPADAQGRYRLDYDDRMFGTPRAIRAKNLFDVRSADMVLAYLPEGMSNTGHQSYGTIVEMAWADMLAKPVILVSNDPEVALHPLLGASASWLLDTLDDAIEVLASVLGAYAPGGRNA